MTLKDKACIVGVVVELEEGVRLVSHVANLSVDELKLGTPVEVFLKR